MFHRARLLNSLPMAHIEVNLPKLLLHNLTHLSSMLQSVHYGFLMTALLTSKELPLEGVGTGQSVIDFNGKTISLIDADRAHSDATRQALPVAAPQPPIPAPESESPLVAPKVLMSRDAFLDCMQGAFMWMLRTTNFSLSTLRLGWRRFKGIALKTTHSDQVVCEAAMALGVAADTATDMSVDITRAGDNFCCCEPWCVNLSEGSGRFLGG